MHVQNQIFSFKTVIKIFFITIIALKSASYASFKDVEVLRTLDLQNDAVKSLRKDVRNAIIIIKRRGNPENLPELKFYKYIVKKDDNFWKILSKTSLNIDTLSTLNSLSSPYDVIPGREILLLNIRGIIYKVKSDDTLSDISNKYNIDKEYLCRVNKISDYLIKKEYIFIPSGEISNIEKSLFLGTGFASPLKKGRRTSSFGSRLDPFNKKFGFHPGLDLACPVGSNVYAARKGRVVYTGYSGGYGLLLVLKHEHGYSSYYGHLKKILLKAGDFVERGDLIAASGESGRSTGPHLHFEVRKDARPINPGILF